ncbi:hypothetical protein BH20GEM2_BH20GEM2_13050 [soil metagenome]
MAPFVTAGAAAMTASTGMTPVWPWFAGARNWLSILVHVLFGGVVAWWYKARSLRRDELRTGAAM